MNDNITIVRKFTKKKIYKLYYNVCKIFIFCVCVIAIMDFCDFLPLPPSLLPPWSSYIMI